LTAFQRRLVKFAKITALLSAVWTALCAVMLAGWQVTSWLQNGVWDAYPLASVIKNLKGEQGVTYATTSSDELKTEPINIHGIYDWVLEIPAIAPLLIALGPVLN
jgi:hypothetical protein